MGIYRYLVVVLICIFFMINYIQYLIIICFFGHFHLDIYFCDLAVEIINPILNGFSVFL